MSGRHELAVTDEVSVTVSDVRGVQRLLMTLVGRRHPFTRLDAVEVAGGRWRITLACLLTEQELHLLRARLCRSPGVLQITWTQDGTTST